MHSLTTYKMVKVTLCKNLRNYFREYCSLSSIHGIRYISEKRRTHFERGWWLIVFLMCLSCCAYFITLVYQKWEDSPVIVSFATRETPIYEIPFPAVTICPESKAIKERYSHSKVVSKLINKKNVTQEEFKHASYMHMLCEVNITNDLDEYKNLYDNESIHNSFYSENDDFFDFMFNVTSNIISSFLQCRWMNKKYHCEDLFDLVLTDEGVCASFNMFDNSLIYREDVYFPSIPFAREKEPKNLSWSIDEGYKDGEGIDTFPRRALYSGAKNALSLIIQELDENRDYGCKLIQGYKIILHTPMRVPRPSTQYFRLPLNEVVIGAVQPVMISTSEKVKVFDYKLRECYFKMERPLKYFKEYTQRNCQFECLTNFTYYWCDCVHFYMPRIGKNNETYICGSLMTPCTDEAEEILQRWNLIKILDSKDKKKNLSEVPDCNCLPLCTDLSYDLETSASVWDWKNVVSALFPNDSDIQTFQEMYPVSMSQLIIYFKNSQFVTSKRHELYGPMDFLGNFGGLLGLFTGFSILSLMEIIYFLTVRIICNLKLYGNWSGSEKDMSKTS